MPSIEAFFSCLAGVKQKNGEELYRFIQGPSYVHNGMLFLMDKDQPIGFMCISIDQDDIEHGSEISGIGLLPEYQGKGLGRQLLRKGIEFCIKWERKNSLDCPW